MDGFDGALVWASAGTRSATSILNPLGGFVFQEDKEMQQEIARRAQRDVISVSLIISTMVASGWGVFGSYVYRDNLLVRSGWYGNDLVTLLLAVPLLAIAYILARKQSPRGTVLWLGMLAYTFYNYAFYLFGAAFNQLYLVYALILILSTLGLIQGLASSDIKVVLCLVVVGRVHRAVGIFIIVVSLILGSFWIATSANYVLTGQLPAMVIAVEHPTNVTAALDLWLVVSFGLLAGMWLWWRRAWGYVISAIWTVKGAVYMTALSAAAIATYASGATEDLSQLGLWVPIGAGSVIGRLLLLRSLPKSPAAQQAVAADPPSADG
ncbi:MAG: hypothetical protein ACOY16_00340 [Chloroflexota bacterium]